MSFEARDIIRYKIGYCFDQDTYSGQVQIGKNTGMIQVEADQGTFILNPDRQIFETVGMGR